MENKFEGHNTFKILAVQSMPMAAAYVLTSISALIVYAFLKDLPESIYALSLAGYAAALIIRNIIASIFDGIFTSGTVLVAEAYGQADSNKMWNVAVHVIAMCLIFSAILSMITIIFGKPLLIFCASDVEAANMVFPTFVFLMATTPLWIVGMMLALLLRGVGDVRFSSMINIINAFGLVILSAILIPQFGLIGAAIASVTSFGIVNTLFYLAMIFSGKSALKPVKGIHFDIDIIKESISLAWPISFRSLVDQGGLALLVSSISSYGAVVIAAWQSSKDIVSFGLAPANASYATSSAIVSARQGVRENEEGIDDLKLCAKGFIKYALVVSISMAVMLLALMPFIPSWISNDVEVMKMMSTMIPIYIFAIALGTSRTVLSGILQGIKKTKLVATVSVVTAIIALWAYPAIILNLDLNYLWVVAAQALDSGLGLVVYAVAVGKTLNKSPSS